MGYPTLNEDDLRGVVSLLSRLQLGMLQNKKDSYDLVVESVRVEVGNATGYRIGYIQFDGDFWSLEVAYSEYDSMKDQSD